MLDHVRYITYVLHPAKPGGCATHPLGANALSEAAALFCYVCESILGCTTHAAWLKLLWQHLVRNLNAKKQCISASTSTSKVERNYLCNRLPQVIQYRIYQGEQQGTRCHSLHEPVAIPPERKSANATQNTSSHCHASSCHNPQVLEPPQS